MCALSADTVLYCANLSLSLPWPEADEQFLIQARPTTERCALLQAVSYLWQHLLLDVVRERDSLSGKKFAQGSRQQL